MRRLTRSSTALPFSIFGLNDQRCTARSAASLNTRGGFAPATLALVTVPSDVIVNSTSTQPSVCLMYASRGYSGAADLTSSAGCDSPAGTAGTGAAAAGGGVAAAVAAGVAAAGCAAPALAGAAAAVVS